MEYDWHFGRLAPYTHAFVSGTLTTLTLTAIVIVVGTVLGGALGLALRKRAIRFILYPVVDVVRALPPLVLLFFLYFSLTKDVIGTAIPAFWVYVIAMSLNLAAFTSDLVRAAIENVPHGEIDGARALGMNHRQVVRHIVLPYVVRVTIPGMTLLYIAMLKMTSLASVINVRELVYTANTVTADITRSLEAWVIVGGIYVVLVVPASYAARRAEAWANRGRIAESEQ